MNNCERMAAIRREQQIAWIEHKPDRLYGLNLVERDHRRTCPVCSGQIEIPALYQQLWPGAQVKEL